MKIAFTGHRPNKFNNDYDLKSPLIHSIRREIIHKVAMIRVREDNTSPTEFIVGMALGIDTLAALIAIDLEIPFTAAIPCLKHDSKWPEKSRKIYQEILAHPLCTVELVSPVPYNSRVMQVRNEWMVDHSEILLAVWDETAGGTANCVAYAKSIEREIVHINPRMFVSTY